jgi:hypothetical protein
LADRFTAASRSLFVDRRRDTLVRAKSLDAALSADIVPNIAAAPNAAAPIAESTLAKPPSILVPIQRTPWQLPNR